MDTREVWVGGCEKTNQRSPSQRREQAGESHGRPRKTRVSCPGILAGEVAESVAGPAVWGRDGEVRSAAGMGIPMGLAVSYRGSATGRERKWGCKPGTQLLHGNRMIMRRTSYYLSTGQNATLTE